MRVVTHYHCPGLFWIRVFGRGFVVKDLRQHPLLFSERYHYRRYWRVGHWMVRWLDTPRGGT